MAGFSSAKKSTGNQNPYKSPHIAQYYQALKFTFTPEKPE
jgi:hypothetical protein